MLFSRMTKNKETQKKIVRMFEMRIEAVELYGQEQIEIGFEKGKIKRELEIAKNMKNNGISNEDIIKYTGISSEDLKSL